MYLKQLKIRNFRCIENLTLPFHRGVNILIGENNSGKSSIVDALRICFSFGSQFKDIFVNSSDFFVDKAAPSLTAENIEFDLHFEILKDDKIGICHEMLVVLPDGQKELQLHVRYYLVEKNGNKKIRYKVGGEGTRGRWYPQKCLNYSIAFI